MDAATVVHVDADAPQPSLVSVPWRRKQAEEELKTGYRVEMK
jgi:hypothetical protein